MEVINMTKKNTVYYLIKKRRLGKQEKGDYFLFENAEWIPDEKSEICDRLMGYDPNEPAGSPYGIGNWDIMDSIEDITKEEAVSKMNELTLEFLTAKWKKDFEGRKEEWIKNGWPAKLVSTEFKLNGIRYKIFPQDIGLTDDCWDQGFMESVQGEIKKDLAKYGATDIYNHGFLD